MLKQQNETKVNNYLPEEHKIQYKKLTDFKLPNPKVMESFKDNTPQNNKSMIKEQPQVQLVEEPKDETNVVTKFAFATRVGFIPNNPMKVNQDNFILHPNIQGSQGCHFFSVCDGHGQNGKEVSTYIKKRLPQLLEENLAKS